MKKLILPVMFLLMIPTPLLAVSVPAVVSPQWLIKNLEQPGLRIIEISEQSSYIFDGHIPGSVYATKSDWRYVADDKALVHFAPRTLQKIIRRLGVNEGDGVVIYYKGQNTDEILGAFYLYWLFHLLGQTNVGILDEGWHGWLKARGPVGGSLPETATGNFVARPLLALEVSTTELNSIRGSYLLVDGRPATHFMGTDKFPANTKYGRIPGSVNQPWADYIREANGHVYAKAPRIPPLLKRLKIKPDQPILLTCFGGTGSAFNYAMFYAAGFRNLRVDDAALRRWNWRNLPLENPAKR
ncbi:MAG: sulfurtransferase [Acidiferrobacterales bacterium]